MLMATNTTIRDVQRGRSGIVVYTANNRYAFCRLFGDKIRGGTKADIEGLVTYSGETTGKNYITSHDFGEVPEAVLDAVSDYATVVDNIEGGWVSWEGRPEFSDTYVDISDAERVA